MLKWYSNRQPFNWQIGLNLKHPQSLANMFSKAFSNRFLDEFFFLKERIQLAYSSLLFFPPTCKNAPLLKTLGIITN
jgi:hypothetical protein